jgi:hypothetical protein
MKGSDLIRSLAALAAAGVAAAGALAVSGNFGQPPRGARRAADTLVRGAQRVGAAVAETGAELAQVWSELRDELAQRDFDPARSRRARRVDPASTNPYFDTDGPTEAPAAPRRRTRAAAAKRGAKASETTSGRGNGSDRRRSKRTLPH